MDKLVNYSVLFNYGILLFEKWKKTFKKMIK